MAISTDGQGRFADPSFHDGYMDGISVADQMATLNLRRSNGERWVLRLSGVIRMVCTDFREGNIVHDIRLAGADPDRTEVLAALNRIDADLEAAEEVVSGELKLLTVTPSYGACIEALCADLELERIG